MARSLHSQAWVSRAQASQRGNPHEKCSSLHGLIVILGGQPEKARQVTSEHSISRPVFSSRFDRSSRRCPAMQCGSVQMTEITIVHQVTDIALVDAGQAFQALERGFVTRLRPRLPVRNNLIRHPRGAAFAGKLLIPAGGPLTLAHP